MAQPLASSSEAIWTRPTPRPLDGSGSIVAEFGRTYIEKDRALSRRFEMILVEEPTISDTIEILKGLKDDF